MSRRSGIRFADNDMRQHETLQRVPLIRMASHSMAARSCQAIASFAARVPQTGKSFQSISGVGATRPRYKDQIF
jgi:hypothetical protein